MGFGRVTFAFLAAGASSLALVSPAAAQSSEGAGALEEIVVTATRQAQSLQDVPMSINVASGETLQKLNLFDVKDVQLLSPGLELSNTVGRNNTATLRGISFDPDQGTSPAVDIYFNEISVDAQTAFTAMYDLEQVEVLRGPQGALRGRTAPAGAITMRTRRPDLNEVDGYVQGTVTDRDAINFQAAASIPLVQDRVAIRAAMLIDRNDLNQVDNVNRDASSRSTTESARVSLALAPTDNFNAVVTYQYLYSENDQYQQVLGDGNQPSLLTPARSGPAAGVKDRIGVTEGPLNFRNRSHMVTLDANWDLGAHTLELLAGHQNTLLRQRSDQDYGNAIPDYVFLQDVRTPYIVNTAELGLASADRSFWNYSASVYYSKQTGDVTVSQPADQFFVNPVPLTPLPPSFGAYLPIQADILAPVNQRTFAIAASSSFQFTDQLRFELAGRYSFLKSIQRSLLTLTSPGYTPAGIPAFVQGPFDTVNPAVATQKHDVLTGGANLTYEFTPDLTAYVSYGRSYRAPTAAVGLTAPLDTSLILTDPERSDAIEVGLKSAFLDRHLTFNISGFWQKFDGYISRVSGIHYSTLSNGISDGQFAFNFNGDATVKGVEATLGGRWDAFDFSASASYVDAKFDNAMAPCNDFNGDGVPDANGAPSVPVGEQVAMCVRNDRIAEQPKFSFTANAEYRFEIGDYEPFVRGLFTYRPGFNSTVANYDYRSRETLNLYAGLRGPDRRWEVSIFAKNLLNQQRISNISQGNFQIGTVAPGVAFDSGYRQISSTTPRELGLTALFNF
nr:TonB-dependent receptor [Sphingomonas laterariae]